MSASSERRAAILSALMKETRSECIVCGSLIMEGELCHIATIYPPGPPGETLPELKTVLCDRCMCRKNSDAVPLLAGSLSFRERRGYLHRVMDARIHGRMSSSKAALLLKGFSLFRRGRQPEEKPRAKMDRLLEETRHKCIYCGGHLNKATFTVDHIVPRARGGQSTYMNSVACCKKCNGAKSDLPLDFFVDSFSRETYREYRTRIYALERERRISREKAEILLGGNGAMYSIRIRLLGSEFIFSVSRRRL